MTNIFESFGFSNKPKQKDNEKIEKKIDNKEELQLFLLDQLSKVKIVKPQQLGAQLAIYIPKKYINKFKFKKGKPVFIFETEGGFEVVTDIDSIINKLKKLKKED